MTKQFQGCRREKREVISSTKNQIFLPIPKLKKLFLQKNEIKAFSGQLGKSENDVKNKYFVYRTNSNSESSTLFQRGHLTPNADFSQGAQRVSFSNCLLLLTQKLLCKDCLQQSKIGQLLSNIFILMKIEINRPISTLSGSF